MPCSTFTYLVEGYFAQNQPSLRSQILSRYPEFFRKLLTSPSKEVRVLARMVSDDPRSTTCQNLRYLRERTKLDKVEEYSSWRVRNALPALNVPEKERWRLGLMKSLFATRSEKHMIVQDSRQPQ